MMGSARRPTMLIRERENGDAGRLRTLARVEKNAEQKDRYLAALHAATGAETLTIAAMLCSSRAFVQRWAYAYRDGGIEALKDKPRGGSLGFDRRVQIHPLVLRLLHRRRTRTARRPHFRRRALLPEPRLVHEEDAQRLAVRRGEIAQGADKKGAVSSLNFCCAAGSCFSCRGRGARHE